MPVRDDVPLEIAAAQDDVDHGTLRRHFAYDLTGYTSALGSMSVYGILVRFMFGPIFKGDLGDDDCISIEYCVLARPRAAKSKKRTEPAENFVDATKPGAQARWAGPGRDHRPNHQGR